MNNKQGNGDGTSRKIIGVGGMIEVDLRISKHLSKWPFNYISTNAGCGWNWVGECDGDSITFLKTVKRHRRKYQAYLIEQDRTNREELRANVRRHLSPEGKVRYYWMDNRKALPRIAREIRWRENPEHAVGFLLNDPNGPSLKRGFCHKQIITFSREFRKIDMGLNINITKLKGLRTLIDSPKMTSTSQRKWIKTMMEQPLTLKGIKESIHKGCWLIREPIISNRYYYVMLIGVNYRDLTSWRTLGFHLWDSPEGREIVNWADGPSGTPTPIPWSSDRRRA